MIDYKTFKKEYLTEWVDRSQAARKAAEELANKEVKPSLRDTYVLPTADNPDLVFTLNGYKVEFKPECEQKRNGSFMFTWDEAMKRFGEPNRKGWRLPTLDEYVSLVDDYDYRFDKKKCIGVFDGRLIFKGLNKSGVPDYGSYWTSESSDDGWGHPNDACVLFAGPDDIAKIFCNRMKYYPLMVRLVREVR